MSETINRYFIVHIPEHYLLPDLETVHLKAIDLFGDLVGPIMKGSINATAGFAVWSSGSHEGRPEDDRHQANLKRLIEHMAAMPRPLRWCRVDSGDEPGDITAEQGSDSEHRHAYEVFTAEVNPVAVSNGNRMAYALDLIERHGHREDPRHKAWVIDQIALALTGRFEAGTRADRKAADAAYEAVIKSATTPIYEPQTSSPPLTWDKGISPEGSGV